MEIRVLRYFLAVAREESISNAAEYLHITQPTLSRQIMELEKQLGRKLLNRGKRNHKITLTNEGILLRNRAEEIITLVDKTKAEFTIHDEVISGNVYIGGGETDAMRFIARTAQKLQADHPILIEPANIEKYNYIKLPVTDQWGLLMRKDSPLAKKEKISPNDIKTIPLITSQQVLVRNEISGWSGLDFDKLNIVATYNLVYNASLMVDEGFGYALCLDKLVNTSESSTLCFKPLAPKLESHLDIVWKKNQVFSKAAEKFLQILKDEITITESGVAIPFYPLNPPNL